MVDQSRSEIITSNPIGRGLDAFHVSFNSICEEKSISCTPDALDQLAQDGRTHQLLWKYLASRGADLQNLTLDLLLALQGLRASRLLSSRGGGKNLFSDLAKLNSLVNADDFDFDRIRPLLNAVLADKPDSEIWDKVYNAVTESTPPPRPIASSLQQTPWLRNTSSFANSSEHRKYVDDVLKPLSVGGVQQGDDDNGYELPMSAPRLLKH